MNKTRARTLWIAAQRLDTTAPFGAGHAATTAAVEHLGYVQIDTINVIERCHHHILFNRIPAYQRADLRQAQSLDKTVFEYWTHALAYVPTRDFRYFVADMRDFRKNPMKWFGNVAQKDLRRVLRLIRDDGALSIRDIADDVLVEKEHPWASRKPSKAALQVAFYNGQVTISERLGMLKTYELMERHFGWSALPRPATPGQRAAYLLDRALRSQGVVSLDSVCFLDAKSKPPVLAEIERRVRGKLLVQVSIDDVEKVQFWATPETLAAPELVPQLTHILSPFDPLIIQRKRLKQLFDYEHLFEAYVPRARRVMGYFTLPVLAGTDIVAGLDLKTDRAAQKLLVQSWHWLGTGSARRHKRRIEEALSRFEQFQLGNGGQTG